MFNLKSFILKGLKESIGKEPDYKVRENALKWLDRGELVQADLEELEQLIEAQYEPVVEMTDEVVEEVLQEENPAESEE